MNKPETSSVTSNKLHKRPWFVLLLAIGVAVTGLCIYFSSVSLSRPYIGADLKLENQQWVVLSVEHPGLAHAKGIEQGDIVISVNGQEPLDFPQEYVGMKIISSHLVNQLSVNSNEETIELSVYNSSIPLANIQETVILSIISFFFLLIGFFVYIKKGMNRASILFYLVSIVAGLEFVTVLAYDRNLFLLFELQAIILIVLPWLVAHLFWIFPSKKKWFTRHPYAEYLLYVPCVIMLVLFFAGGHSAGQDSPWFRVAIAMNLAAGLLFGLSLLFHSYATATSIRTRQQSKMIFVGMLLAILPMLLLVVLPDVIISRKIVPVHIAGLFLLFSPLSISYTIVKYQLMDINVVLKKGTSYLLMSTIVAIPYVLLIYLATTHLRPDLLAPVLIPLLVLLALGMNPIWSRVQNKVDKWFYRQRYDFLKNLERFNQEAHSINDIGKFGFSIVHLLNQSIEDTYISLLLLTESKNYTTIATTEDNSVHVSLKSNNPVSKWLKLNMKILHHWEIELTEQLQALTDKQQQEIKNIELFAPLITPNSEMVGILLLGPRKQGRKYSQADELLIMTIAKRVSIELENARLYNLEKGMRKELESQDEQKTELLFSIAHELKTPLSAIVSSSELLSSEIAARSNHREANLIRNVSRSAWWMSKRVTELLSILPGWKYLQ